MVPSLHHIEGTFFKVVLELGGGFVVRLPLNGIVRLEEELWDQLLGRIEVGGLGESTIRVELMVADRLLQELLSAWVDSLRVPLFLEPVFCDFRCYVF